MALVAGIIMRFLVRILEALFQELLNYRAQ